jgi:hypothetical protein
MRTAIAGEPARSVAVTTIGLLTLLWGVGYAVLGGSAIVGGIGWLTQPGDDPWTPVITLFGFLPALVVVIGIAFLLVGILGLLAGSGVLRLKQWGRILTFLAAVLAILLGAASLSAYEGATALEIALGVVQILYGILAIVILSMNGPEFTQAQA